MLHRKSDSKLAGKPVGRKSKKMTATKKNLKLVIVENDTTHLQDVSSSLEVDGWDEITILEDAKGLAKRLEDIKPDLILIGLSNPNRDSLEQLSLATNAQHRPVVMYVDRSNDELTQAAVSAGLSAYVVGQPDPERIKSVLQVAVARFQVHSQMRRELEFAKQALEDRKNTDRAKGILMRTRGLTEEEAYALLRKTAMSKNKKVIDVANALITASELLG